MELSSIQRHKTAFSGSKTESHEESRTLNLLERTSRRLLDVIDKHGTSSDLVGGLQEQEKGAFNGLFSGHSVGGSKSR